MQRSIGRCGTCCFTMYNIEAAAHPFAGLCQPCHRTDEGAAQLCLEQWMIDIDRPDSRLIEFDRSGSQCWEVHAAANDGLCAPMVTGACGFLGRPANLEQRDVQDTCVLCVLKSLYFLSWFLTWEGKFKLSTVSTHSHPFSIITGLVWSVRGSRILCGGLLKAHSTF